jgi:dihydropteroate synthase
MPQSSPPATFGERARALELRALGPYAWSAFARAPDARVRLHLRAERLTAAERDALAAVPGASFCAIEARATEPRAAQPRTRAQVSAVPRVDTARELASLAGCALYECELAELSALAEARPELEPMRAVLAAAHAAPAAPELMGVVNATPDSFSDAGLHLDPARALEHGLALEAAGAQLLDVGGESTRPGARAVPIEAELARVLPIVRALARGTRCTISIDTRNAQVARAALEAGASLVNDVSGGTHDPAMLPLVAAAGCGYLVMHMRGTPADMQRAPRYDDAVGEVLAELRARLAACCAAGIAPERLIADPGIGFGKRLAHNLELLRGLGELRSLGLPLAIGVSRKSFLGELSGEARAQRRGSETLAALSAAVLHGASLLRVHELAPARAAMLVARALAQSGARPAPEQA